MMTLSRALNPDGFEQVLGRARVILARGQSLRFVLALHRRSPFYLDLVLALCGDLDAYRMARHVARKLNSKAIRRTVRREAS